MVIMTLIDFSELILHYRRDYYFISAATPLPAVDFSLAEQSIYNTKLFSLLLIMRRHSGPQPSAGKEMKWPR